MPLLIDGHNLIGSNIFEDIRLSDEDDEARLVARLRAWRGRYAGKIEVVFDHGITEGRSALLSGGGVEVFFARNPTDADDLIRRRLRRPKKDLILVTNDTVLRQDAEHFGVGVWRPDEFVAKMLEPPSPKPRRGEAPPAGLSEKDVEAWLHLFDTGPALNQDNPIWTPPFKPTKRRRIDGGQRSQPRRQKANRHERRKR